MKEFLVYSLARLGLFVASYAIVVGIYLLVTGERSIPMFWPFLVAIGMSSIASVYFLKAQRGRFAAAVERRAANASRRFEESRRKEDETGG